MGRSQWIEDKVLVCYRLTAGKVLVVAWHVRLAAEAFLLPLQKKPKQGKGEPGFPLCKPH